jgi:prophage DNA circulation protein
MAPASFRGVEFWVESDERSGGRDGEAHAVPGSEAPPYVEDTGRKGRVFRLDGFLVGEDCLSARGSLLTALELEGSGDLVHPAYGVLRVSVQDYSTRYTSREGGKVTLSITFAETTAEPVYVLDVLAPEGTVAAAAEPFQEASLAEFLSSYVVVPYSAELQAQLATLTQAVSQVMSVKALADSDAASLHQQITALTRDASALAGSPLSLAQSTRGLLASLATGLRAATSGVDPLIALLSVYKADPGERPDDSTPDGAAAAAGFDAMASLNKREVLAQAAGMCAATAYTSHEEAVGARTRVTDLMDDYAETAEDSTYTSMTGLRRALCQAVPSPESDLPHIEKLTLPGSLPSIVVSYTVYGDLDHEADMLTRNKVSDPTYLPGATALEVLSS